MRTATMRAAALGVAVAWAIGARAAVPDGLRPLEHDWLQAARPVLAAAVRWALPLDVVVQPQPAAGESPLAVGLLGGRCKLLMTLRGPSLEPAPGVDTTLDAARIEAMFVHEVAHCWRHAQGAWHALPAGFTEPSPDPGAAPALAALERDMHATRREEGFADLVALAWTAERHPEHYPRVYAWLASLRADPPFDGAHHDTRAWLALVRDPAAFGEGGSVFDRARRLWVAGLAGDGR